MLSYLLVYNPLKAKLIASIASMMPQTNPSTLNLMLYAHTFDACNTKILIDIGDLAARQKNIGIALWSYGQGMLCQPANALLRIKYGESLLMAGFNGLFAIQESTLLEPHNPIFLNERARVEAIHLPLF